MTVKDLAAMVTFPTTISIVDKERGTTLFQGDCTELRYGESYLQSLEITALSTKKDVLIGYVKK